MPGHFLTEAERERLSHFPREISPDDVHTYFTLSPADLTQVQACRGDHNRLGFALQLGALRYLGFCPDELTQVPAAIVTYLASQLSVAPTVLAAYGDRAQTRTDHVLEICTYLGFHEATESDLQALATWVTERALEHDKPLLLFELAAEKLYAGKIVRPGVTVLERLVGSARERAEQETFRRLGPLLNDQRRAFLDKLLQPDEHIGRTRLDWLRQGATGNTARAILEAIEKLDYLRAGGVDAWDLEALTPNRRKFLAQLGKRATNQILQRAVEQRRYPILLAFLRQALEDTTDEAVDLYDRYLAHAYSRAGRELAEFRQTAARATNEKVRLFHEVGRLVLDPAIADPELRAAIYAQVPAERLQAAVEECEQLMRPLDDNYFDFLSGRYSTVRTFAPEFLEAFTFHARARTDPLLKALALLRTLNQEGRRTVPDDAPLGWVPAKWRPYVVESEDHISRRYYELCALWELRSALRAGNVWLEGSRRYADPDSYLIAPDKWPALRPEVCRLIQAPEDGQARLRQRQDELAEQLTQLEKTLQQSDQVRIEHGKLIVSPLKAQALPESALALQAQITERLPRIELADLLIEVDQWTHFSQAFEHAGGSEPRTSELQTSLYASILAQACNFGLTTMAQIADLSYWRLAWCTNWYVREETLRAAMTAIVNYQYHEPLSQAWGGGTLSSSDGQRFPVAVQTRAATALPRYFGYGRGLTFYTWTSDQFSQYGTKVIPATVRDATYVLDEILDNETELAIVEHTTDTAGYTELVFALFDLLGLQFAPRIRDLGDQRLYRLDSSVCYPSLEPLLKGTIHQDRITPQWDDLLRVAGSLKLGWVTSSLLIGKLQAFPRRNVLTRALQEYGRLTKTLFILRYLNSEAYRRRIEVQLNKGEALHALRRFIFFANQGQLRRHQDEDQANQASCLNVVTNAVVTWNTVYMAAVIKQLEAEGQTIQASDLAHLSPARYEHINPYGKYRFNLEGVLSLTQLRPLRQPENGGA